MTTKAKKNTKTSKSEAPPTKAKPGAPRVTVLGYSATSILKWMGANDWTREQAVKAFSKLAEGGEVKPSTISTGLSDGRSEKYRAGAAPVTAAQAKQLAAAAK